MHLDGEEENVAIKKMRVGGASMHLVVSVSAVDSAQVHKMALRVCVHAHMCVGGGIFCELLCHSAFLNSTHNNSSHLYISSRTPPTSTHLDIYSYP